jgi:hypothetical protein
MQDEESSNLKLLFQIVELRYVVPFIKYVVIMLIEPHTAEFVVILAI